MDVYIHTYVKLQLVIPAVNSILIYLISVRSQRRRFQIPLIYWNTHRQCVPYAFTKTIWWYIIICLWINMDAYGVLCKGWWKKCGSEIRPECNHITSIASLVSEDECSIADVLVLNKLLTHFNLCHIHTSWRRALVFLVTCIASPFISLIAAVGHKVDSAMSRCVNCNCRYGNYKRNI